MTSNDLRKYRAFRDRILELGEAEPRTIDELFDSAIALKRLLGKEMTSRRKQSFGFLMNNLTSTCDRTGWLNVECEGNRIVFSTDGYEFDF